MQTETKKKQNNAYKRKYYIEHRDEIIEKMRKKRCNEEYRAKRRAEYAEKHKDDPMTEHRKRCIEARKKRSSMPLDEYQRYRNEKQFGKSKRIADNKSYEQGEIECEKKREIVVKYIERWATRKTQNATYKNGEIMCEADIWAYHREAVRYCELRKRMDETDLHDYSTRNILSYKMRVIEEHFGELLNRNQHVKSKLV